jgi:transcriptional regulator GlxA family with amidase domain
MLEAATLLRESPIALNQVARMLGYANESNFCRDFREAFGRSATAYREERRLPRLIQDSLD